MSTYLELVQDLHRESGASGSAPTSVLNQSGEAARMVGWVKEADSYVKNLWLNWKFLWNQVTLNTAVGVVGLSKPTDLLFWDYKTMKLNAGGVGDEDEPMDVVEHDMIKWQVRDTSQARPSRIIIMPDNNLEFEPVPDAAYQIKSDYFKRPTILAANSDVSEIPVQYHPIILGRALILYANFENAPEVKAQGEEIYLEYLGRLENHELPNQRFSRYQSTGSFFDVNANEDSGGLIVGGDGSW